MEGNVLWGGRMETLYGKSPVMILHLAEQLEGTEAGEKLLDWVLSGLKAYSENANVPEKNHYKPMWADGTDISGQVMPRTGYYGEKGTPFKPLKPNGDMMLALAKAVRLSDGDEVLWNTFRHQFKGINFGDPGEKLVSEPDLNLETANADPKMLVMVLEIYKATQHPQFLKLAERIGDNILEDKFHEGYFRPTVKHKYIKFDSPEPLALLMLEEARQGVLVTYLHI
ncbi:MAG: hypothetical protein RI564_07120 [Gracilimonas sp.]|nr:hypothetical protein [Gracilimonas sp.]